MEKTNTLELCILPNKNLCKELKLDTDIKQHLFGIPYISSLDTLINFLDNMDITKFNTDELEWYFIVLKNYLYLQKELRHYVSKYIKFKKFKNENSSNKVLKKILELIHNNKVHMKKILNDSSVPQDIYLEAKKYIDNAINLDKKKQYKKSQKKYKAGLNLIEKGISKNSKKNRIDKIKSKSKYYKKRIDQISINLYFDRIKDIDKKIEISKKNKSLKLLHYNKILKILEKLKTMSDKKKHIEKVDKMIEEYRYKIRMLNRF